MKEVTWLGEYREEGVVYFRIGRHGDDLVAEWPSIATLRANTQAGTSTFEAHPDADAALVEKVHKSLARALLRHLDHKLTLHGAAACRDGRAVAIVGGSGAGKSTLAAAIARKPSVSFLADDTLAIELAAEGAHSPMTIMPTERESWLLPDACAALGIAAGDDKKPVAHERIGQAARLVAVVVPTFVEEGPVTLTRARGLTVLSALVPAVVRFVIDDPRVQIRELEQLDRLVAAVPVYTLARPRSLDLLDETACRVLALLSEKSS